MFDVMWVSGAWTWREIHGPRHQSYDCLRYGVVEEGHKIFASESAQWPFAYDVDFTEGKKKKKKRSRSEFRKMYPESSPKI